MQIRVNDELITVEAALTLNALLQHLNFPTSGTALALNQTIIPRARWAELSLQENDTVTIFQAIAGG